MQLLSPDDPGYDDLRATYNPQVDCRPSTIALCSSEADVQAAVRHARAHDLEIAVRSCGHSVPGYSTVDGGIVIDLSSLTAIAIDAATRRARVQPGLTAGAVEEALAPHGLVAAAGLEPTPGYVGLAIHGGRGLLGRRHGWSGDHIRAARLVTAEGDVIVVSADEHADLLYGLRGLGSSFGIVTELEVDVHPIPETVLGGPRVYGPDQLRTVLPGVLALFDGDAISDDLDAMCTLFLDGGAPHLELHLLHAGTPEVAERDLARIDALGPPIDSSLVRASYAEYLHGSDHPPLDRYVWAEEASSLPADALAPALLGATDALPAAATDGVPNHYLVWEPFGRAFLREPDLPTPLPARRAATIAFFGLWNDPARDAEMNAWAATGAAQLRRTGVTDGTPVLNYNSVTGPEAVRRAYGDAAYDRLRDLKRRYDPDNVFLRNHGADLPDR